MVLKISVSTYFAGINQTNLLEVQFIKQLFQIRFKLFNKGF